jgi:hypothetical protein
MNNEEVLATVADFQRVFDSPEGKNVLAYLMKTADFMRTTYVPNDPYGTAFNEGRRAIVIDIVNRLKIDIRALEKLLMKEESNKGDQYVSI